ncbi:SOS response-associated peptidase [Naumannella huperziae]
MCGRYAHWTGETRLVSEFGIDKVMDELPGPDYNVAPTDEVPAVLVRTDRETGEPQRRLAPLRWGLVPSWAKDPKIGARMINARVETVAEKPAFRKAFATRRCLLPADGYYEWYATEPASPGGKPGKQPFFVRNADHSLLAMAGLYEFWRDPSRADDDPQAWLRTCTVITTTATDAVGQIHDRMPLLVAPENRGRWLDPAISEPAELLDLIGVGTELEAYAVSRAVGNVANNGPELVEPLPDADDAPERLF